MKSELVEKLSSDLSITQFKYEDDICYYSRLLYSAMSDWMKICILDHTNEKYVEYKSKLYIHIRCEEILNNFLLLFPECSSYFYADSDGENHPVNILRKKMISTGELVNQNNDIYLPEGARCSINSNYLRTFGVDGFKTKSAGISKLKYNFEKIKGNNLFVKNIHYEYKKLFRSLKWETYSDYSTIEVMDPNSKRPPYKSWKDIQIVNEQEIYLARIEININQKMLFWIRKQNNEVQISKMNNDLVRFQETRRFILWQRKKHENAVNVFYCSDDNYVSVKMFAAIPTYEQNILDTYGWPVGNIQNKREYIFPVEVWEEISTLLVNLNFELMEEDYGSL